MPETSTPRTQSARRLWSIFGFVLIASSLGAGAYLWSQSGFSSRGLSGTEQAAALAQARQALDDGRPDVAEQIAAAVLKAAPDSPGAHLVLGEIAAAHSDNQAALAHFDSVPASAGDLYERALLEGGVACLADDRLQAAEMRLRKLLSQFPANLDAHRHLARLLTLTGRRRQSTPHLVALVRADAFDLEHLLMLADPDSVIDFSVDLDRALRRDPTDPLPRIGLARIAQKNGDTSRALTLIREAVRLAPHDATAQAVLGQLLVETDPAEIAAWHSSLLSAVADDAEIWAVLGQASEAQGSIPAAIRCYGEAVMRHPNHRRSVYRLGHLLTTQGRAAEGQALLSRAALLDELISAVDVLLRQPNSLPHLVRAAQITEQLGRLWEAQAWYAILAAHDSGSGYRQKRDEIRSRLAADSPFDSDNPAGRIELASYPLPTWKANTVAPADHRAGGDKTPPVELRLRDVAREQELEFSYVSGDDPTVAGWEIFQELGGGVGVIDFDRDRWPDLYFPQGCAWPPADFQPQGATSGPDHAAQPSTDRLFRNHRGARAEDVTEKACLADFRYGQGVAIGDFDNDGFPDIYVANLGVNRLYRNLGDGTFLDVTSTAIALDRRWTTSCAIADLDGDSLPDLFDATYLAGDDPLTRRCVARGIRRACSPDQFAGEQDRLLLNLGDGRFSEVGMTAGITGSNGKGLGLLIADFHASGRLSLFVANDGTPNFFYVNQARRGEPPAFVEQAVVSGLAVSGEGRSQASMGIAFDDVEQDGGWDMFVTNFYREGGVLYRQHGAELFDDATRTAGLLSPTIPFTGFGAQFADLALVGQPDLVVLNGHIEDFRYQDVPFQMRAQVFRQQGGGQFIEIAGRDVGPYFEREQLGRALAVLDWNRDGRY